MTTLMKDSGIDWIGKIPEEWRIKRVKDIFNIGRGVVIAASELKKEPDEKNIYPVYSSATEKNGVIGYLEDYKFDEDLITWTTDGVNAGTIFKRSGKFNCTNVCGTLKAKEKKKINLNYFKFMLISQTRFYKRPDINGAKIMNNEMARIIVSVPPFETQQKIADYLDVEVSKLDKQVSLLERKYALLGDYKDALIFETVTQGLDKAVPMKDSGIDWIGEIPEGWKIIKCGNIFYISSGTTPNTKNEMFYNSKDVNWLNSGDFHNSYINDTKNKISFFAKEYLKLKEFKSGSIVIAMYGANIGDVGFLNIDTTVNQACAVLVDKKNKKIINKYFYYLFINKKNEFIGKSYGGGQKNINQGLIHQSYLQLPPLETQQEIADYLDVEVAKLDKQRELIKRKVELLKEYKEALIFEVVTGKKEVK